MTTFWEYGSHVRKMLIRESKLVEMRGLKITPDDADNGVIKTITDTPLIFKKDKATLSVLEVVRIKDNEMTVPKYSYHYESPDGYYFRYDRDPKRHRPFLHEICHLHVCKPAPRFLTHETSFEEIFGFIVANFYA